MLPRGLLWQSVHQLRLRSDYLSYQRSFCAYEVRFVISLSFLSSFVFSPSPLLRFLSLSGRRFFKAIRLVTPQMFRPRNNSPRPNSLTDFCKGVVGSTENRGWRKSARPLRFTENVKLVKIITQVKFAHLERGNNARQMKNRFSSNTLETVRSRCSSTKVFAISLKKEQ